MVTNSKLLQIPASITIHFDGAIVNDHRVSVRTLGKTLDHIQNAIDRAYLDVKYGNVMKYQKLRKGEYEDVDFLALNPRDGGYILEMISVTGRGISDRIASAIAAAYEKDVVAGEGEHRRLMDQATIQQQVYRATGEAQLFPEFVANREGDLARAFGDRSIVKEIDQILSLVRMERYEGSTFDISLYGTKSHPTYEFDSARAARFHEVVSERRVGAPILIKIELRSLDSGRAGQLSRGKAKNIETGKEFNFLVTTSQIFDRLARHLKRSKRNSLSVVACPVYEYDAFDTNAGDVILIAFEGVINE